MLMVGTIIGPGTIFLMLVGAFVAAFKISNWDSFYYNLAPIVAYTVCCLTCKTNIQVWDNMKYIVTTLCSVDVGSTHQTIFCACALFSANFVRDPVHLLRSSDDGGNCGYFAAVRRGRNRFSISYLSYRYGGVVLHRRLPPPTRVLVHRPGSHLLAVHPRYVPASHHLLHYEPKRCLLGNQRGIEVSVLVMDSWAEKLTKDFS